MQSACAILCCQVWPVWLAVQYFLRFLANGTIFEKKRELIKHKILLIFTTTFV